MARMKDDDGSQLPSLVYFGDTLQPDPSSTFLAAQDSNKCAVARSGNPRLARASESSRLTRCSPDSNGRCAACDIGDIPRNPITNFSLAEEDKRKSIPDSRSDTKRLSQLGRMFSSIPCHGLIFPLATALFSNPFSNRDPGFYGALRCKLQRPFKAWVVPETWRWDRCNFGPLCP